MSQVVPVNQSQNVADFTRGNDGYASNFTQAEGELKGPPSKKLAVVTCMDARMHPEKILGLNNGEAHMIRNAGGRYDTDARRSLVISQRMLGTREIVLIHHTSCGMATFANKDLCDVVEKDLGRDARGHADKVDWRPFKDLEQSVKDDVQAIINDPLIQDVPVHGYIYDIKTGRLQQVQCPTQKSASGVQGVDGGKSANANSSGSSQPKCCVIA